MYSQYDAFGIQCEQAIRDAEATGDAVKISATVLGCYMANSMAIDRVAKEVFDNDFDRDVEEDKRFLILESTRLAIGDAEARHEGTFKRFFTRTDGDEKLASGMIVPSSSGNFFIAVKDDGEIRWTTAQTNEQHAIVGQFAEEMKSVLDENLRTLGFKNNQNEKIINAALANVDFSNDKNIGLSK